MGLNIRAKAIKFLEENIGKKSLWPLVMEKSLSYDTKNMNHKRKKITCFNKIKIFAL